jgi:hypothetical protein
VILVARRDGRMAATIGPQKPTVRCRAGAFGLTGRPVGCGFLDVPIRGRTIDPGDAVTPDTNQAPSALVPRRRRATRAEGPIVAAVVVALQRDDRRAILVCGYFSECRIRQCLVCVPNS